MISKSCVPILAALICLAACEGRGRNYESLSEMQQSNDYSVVAGTSVPGDARNIAVDLDAEKGLHYLSYVTSDESYSVVMLGLSPARPHLLPGRAGLPSPPQHRHRPPWHPDQVRVWHRYRHGERATGERADCHRGSRPARTARHRNPDRRGQQPCGAQPRWQPRNAHYPQRTPAAGHHRRTRHHHQPGAHHHAELLRGGRCGCARCWACSSRWTARAPT